MNTRAEEVEIQEPPVEEFRKKKPKFIRGCVSSCGCLGLVLIASILFLNVIAKPKPTELSQIPTYLSETIPIYQPNYVQKIEVVSGKKKNKDLERLAYIPKLLSAPIAGFVDTDKTKNESFTDRVITHIKTPVTNPQDEITLTWIKLPIAMDQIIEYYKTELAAADFTVTAPKYLEKENTLQFSKKRGTITGELYIENRADTPDTEVVVLKIFTLSD